MRSPDNTPSVGRLRADCTSHDCHARLQRCRNTNHRAGTHSSPHPQAAPDSHLRLPSLIADRPKPGHEIHRQKCGKGDHPLPQAVLTYQIHHLTGCAYGIHRLDISLSYLRVCDLRGIAYYSCHITRLSSWTVFGDWSRWRESGMNILST